MTKDEALKLALDYLERHAIIDGIPARDAIREVLAQPEQEPVAWMCQEYRAAFMGDMQWFDEVEFVQPPNDPERFRNITPLYAAPPQCDEAEHDLKDVRCGCCGYMTYHREHLGCIRSAPPQFRTSGNTEQNAPVTDSVSEIQKREWVGLTHAELIEIYNQKTWDTIETWDYEQAIEAKLKEKNT